MSKQLVTFIQSLGQSEKRYIHLYLKTFSGNDSINLNDFVEVEKNSHKKNYKQKTKGNPTRLYYKLIDILAEYHRENLNVNNIDYINLNRAKLLFSKGYTSEAEKLISKILDSPSGNNHLIKVEAIELRLMNAVNNGQVNYLSQQFEGDKEKLRDISEDYTNLINYELLWAASKYENTSSYFFEKRNNYSEKQYTDFLTSEDQAISPLAKILFNKIKGYEAIKAHNIQLAISHSKRAIDIFEDNPGLIHTNTVEFLKSIRNYCIALNHDNKISEAESFMNSIQTRIPPSYFEKNMTVKIEAYTLFSLIRLDLIINGKLINERSEMILESEKKFNNLKEQLPKDQFLASSFQFIICYLCANNPRKAIKYINSIIKNAGETRKDILHLAYISEMVVHFKLGNIELIESKLNSFRKLVQKTGSVFGFENELHTHFNKIIREPEINSHFKNFISSVEKNLIEEKKEFYLNFNPIQYLKA